MIICLCQNYSDHDINAAIDWMRASDDKTIVTPGKIYRALGKTADGGGCMPLFLSTMRTNDNVEVSMQPPVLTGIATQEEPHERRQESNSVSHRRTAS